jgi:hypothetical protein
VNLDAPLRKVAQTILKTFGTASSLRRVTGTAYNTTTRTMTPTTADTAWKVRVDEYKGRELSDTIHAGDRKVTGAAADLAFTPTVDDKWVYGGLVYDIIRVEPYLATDLAAIHILQVRR